MKFLFKFFENNGTEILGRWKSVAEPGDGQTPKLWVGRSDVINRTNEPSTRFVEKGDFIRINNISLGYTLPTKIISKIGVSKFKAYVQVQNAAVFTKYKGLDPEVSTNGGFGLDFNGNPQQRTIVLGFNVGF